MWLNRFTNYLLQRRWQSLVLTLLITFVPILGILGIIIAALVTLCKGVVEGAIFAIAATIPYIISFYFSGNHDVVVPLVLWAAVGVAVLSNVFTWAFAVMLYRQASWSAIIQVAALFGVLVISLIHLFYPNIVDWWGNQLLSYYNQAQAVTGALKPYPLQKNNLSAEVINVTKQYATGMMVAAVLLNGVMQLIVARWWQAAVYNPGGLRKELHQIRLSQLAGILFVASMVLSYLGNSVVLDIMPILYILFGGAGLSLVHYLFSLMNSKTAWIWLMVLYLLLIFSLPTSMVMIAIVALFDSFFNVRERVKTKTL